MSVRRSTLLDHRGDRWKLVPGPFLFPHLSPRYRCAKLPDKCQT